MFDERPAESALYIKIIDISVCGDNVHFFIKYGSKTFRKFYCKEDQRTIEQNIETDISKNCASIIFGLLAAITGHLDWDER